MTRQELMQKMPVNGADTFAAAEVVRLGYPAVEPVMRDMMRWLRVTHSPVADIFARFFAEIGEPALGVMIEALSRNDPCIRHRVLSQVLPSWPAGLVGGLTNYLTMIATQTDVYNNDLKSIEMLAAHRLVERDWIAGWMEFKQQRMEERDELIAKIEQILNGAQQDHSQDGSSPKTSQ